MRLLILGLLFTPIFLNAQEIKIQDYSDAKLILSSDSIVLITSDTLVLKSLGTNLTRLYDEPWNGSFIKELFAKDDRGVIYVLEIEFKYPENEFPEFPMIIIGNSEDLYLCYNKKEIKKPVVKYR